MYQFLQDESGSAAMEYSLFIGLIGLVVAGALHVLGTNLFNVFSSISEGFPTILVTEDPRNPNKLVPFGV